MANFKLFVGNLIQSPQACPGFVLGLFDNSLLLLNQTLEPVDLALEFINCLFFICDILSFTALDLLFGKHLLKFGLPFFKLRHLLLLGRFHIFLLGQQANQRLDIDDDLIQQTIGFSKPAIIKQLAHFVHFLGDQLLFGLLVSLDQ